MLNERFTALRQIDTSPSSLPREIFDLGMCAELVVDATHKNATLFGGTKVLQSSPGEPAVTPDGGCLAVVLRTGFGTAQGQLVRTMLFSTERVSANNLESFVFLGFPPIFAIAASWYVWVKGIERGLKNNSLIAL